MTASSKNNIEHEELKKMLQDILRNQEESGKREAARDEREKAMTKITLANEEAIKGNGKPGLNERMSIQEEREAKRDRREWLIQSAVILEVIGLIMLGIFK